MQPLFEGLIAGLIFVAAIIAMSLMVKFHECESLHGGPCTIKIEIKGPPHD